MQVDYKPIANGATANVISQAQYELDLASAGSLENGYLAGVAQSNQVNKTVRQSSVIAACVANFISEELVANILDDGNVPALVIQLRAAIIAAVGNPFSTGDLKMTMKTVADAGWVLCNDLTIGDAISGAAYANANAEALFTLIWNNVPNNLLAPVLPAGRGANAAADWAANKTIGLTKMLGRALAIAGAGAGLTARVLGSTAGTETVALTVNQLATHGHVVNDPGHLHSTTLYSPSGGGPFGAPPTSEPSNALLSTGSSATGVTVQDTGAGDAHPNMQPTSFVNVMIKL